jgi:cytidyltransferase-like protein
MVGGLFHAGHVELLRAARAHGDHLIVGVLSDETAAACKRPPIIGDLDDLIQWVLAAKAAGSLD